MKFVKRCLGTGAALALASLPAFGAGAGQAVPEKSLIQDQMQQQVQQQQGADQSVQQVTQDQAQQIAQQAAQQVAQRMTQDQAQQVQQSQGLIVRVSQDGRQVLQRLVTQQVNPSQLRQEDVEALFDSSEDATGILVSDDGAMNVEHRYGYVYRPYYRPYVYTPYYTPVVYTYPYYYPYGNYGYWYYPRYR